MLLPTPSTYFPVADDFDCCLEDDQLLSAYDTAIDQLRQAEEERTLLLAKYSEFSDGLNNIFSINDPNLAYKSLISTICKHFKVNSKSKPFVKNIKPWITLGIKKSIKIRNKLFRKKQLVLAKFYKSKIKHYINILRENYFKEAIFKETDPKRQWNLLNKFLKNENKQCKFKGNINDINKYFATVGNKLASKIPKAKTEINQISFCNSMFFSEITCLEISNIIKSLKEDKAKGSDNISIKLIKELRPILVEPLTYILNLCIEKSVFPEKMKIATIVPIYKNSGTMDDPSNFRPISLLPIFSKIFEKCIYERLQLFRKIRFTF